MNTEQREELRRVMHRIARFNDHCEAAQYTDTGDAWEVLQDAHDTIEALFTPTKPPAPEYKCDECGGHRLHRCFYVWADAVTGEFFINDAECTDSGQGDWYCLDCDDNVLASIIEEQA